MKISVTISKYNQYTVKPKLPPTKMKTICDIILLSAMPKKTTVLDHSKLETLSELVNFNYYMSFCFFH
jgi:predicted metal-dependent TIM-barrel fold hydrolase